MKNFDVSNEVIKNNFLCHINYQLHHHVKLLKYIYIYISNLLLTHEIKFGKNSKIIKTLIATYDGGEPPAEGG